MLSPARVEVVRGRVCDIASGVIGHDCNIIAYLVLVRPAFERTERGADGHVRRPGNTAISAVRVEQLRVRVVGSVSRVMPDRVQATVGRDCKCAKPVPFARINRIVIDLLRRAEG